MVIHVDADDAIIIILDNVSLSPRTVVDHGVTNAGRDINPNDTFTNKQQQL